MRIQKKQVKPVLYLLLLVVGLTMVWIVLTKIDYFKIQKVTINGNEIDYRQKWILLHEDYDKNIFEVDINKLKENLRSLYSTDSIQITKKYPDCLSIEIWGNNFMAFIKIFDPNQENSTIFGMNEKGQIISQWTDSSKNITPVIELRQAFFVNQWRSGQMKIGLKIEDKNLLTSIRSLAMMKVMDPSFFNRIEFISLDEDQQKNYFMLHQIQTKFYFGEILTLFKLVKVDSLLEDLATKINFKTIDLRFDDVLGRN